MVEKKPLDDEKLSQVAGGAGEGEDSETRTVAGICGYCGKCQCYHVVRVFYTENGRNELEYYECDRCGRFDEPPQVIN